MRCSLRYKADMKKLAPLSTSGCKAEITYPCQWQYKIIGEDSNQIKLAVASAVRDTPYDLASSNTSSTGRYVSFNLELEVTSEEQRLGLYQSLAANPAVKVVL